MLKHEELPLIERIDAALKRITTGQGQMRVPPEATDPDIALSDAKARILELEALATQAGKALEKFKLLSDAGLDPDMGEAEPTLSAIRAANLLPTRAEGGE